MRRLPAIPEASGVAVGARPARRLWVLNDSGEPFIYSVDQDGTVVDRVQVAGARLEDWEDLALGPCPSGSCLYVADIGDNDLARSRVTVYRVPEPPPGATATRSAAVFHARYPDGPHNAEGFFVTPDGRMFIVTKDRSTAIFSFPVFPREGSTSTLERVTTVDMPASEAKDAGHRRGVRAERATGAAMSPAGDWVALRSNDTVSFFRLRDLIAGRPPDPIRLDVREQREPQGEAIAFGAGGVVYLVGEGGSKDEPGTLTRMTCALPRWPEDEVAAWNGFSGSFSRALRAPGRAMASPSGPLSGSAMGSRMAR